MKTISKIIISLVFVLLAVSCHDEGKVTVVNNLASVKLTSISFGGYAVSYSLLPGEKGSVTISEEWDNVSFPITKEVYFYMVKGDDRVYLRTKETFILKKDGDLVITISEDTEVENIMNNKSATLKKCLSELSDEIIN